MGNKVGIIYISAPLHQPSVTASYEIYSWTVLY